MSLYIKYKEATKAQLHEHCRRIIDITTATEDFKEQCNRADAMGIDISVYVRDSYTEDKLEYYRLPSDDEDIPYGYAAQICFDMVQGNHVLFAANEYGEYNQMSLSYEAVVTPSTMFVKKLRLLEPEEIAGLCNLAPMMEQLLDMAEAYGTVGSVVFEDDLYSERAARPHGIVREEVDCFEDHRYFELQGGDSSLYFSEHGFLPYMFVIEAGAFGTFDALGNAAITPDMWRRVAADLSQMLRNIRYARDFEGLMGECGLFAVMPTARCADLLDEVTYWRLPLWKKDVRALIEWGDKLADQNIGISVIKH